MRSIANAVLLGILALLLSATLTTQDAHAATLDEFNSTCFTDSGFEGTDGCFEAAESLGIEMDNLLSSIEQGCTQYFEDYSCKEGSSEPPSSPSSEEQAEVSEQGTVSDQEPLQLVTEGSYITDYNARTQEAILHDPTMDVVGSSYETAVVEWIEPVSEQDSVSEQERPTPQNEDQAENLAESQAKGCAPANLLEDLSCKGPEYKGYEKISERPVTQQGTLAPKDWKEHVTPVKPANPLEKDSLAKRTPLAIQYSPSGASAQCYDGTYSTSVGSGTCSGHGGIYSYFTSV